MMVLGFVVKTTHVFIPEFTKAFELSFLGLSLANGMLQAQGKILSMNIFLFFTSHFLVL